MQLTFVVHTVFLSDSFGVINWIIQRNSLLFQDLLTIFSKMYCPFSGFNKQSHVKYSECNWICFNGVCQWFCIIKALFWTFLSGPVVLKMGKRWFHAGPALRGTIGLGCSASLIQNVSLRGFLVEILETHFSRVGMRTATFKKDRLFWVIVSGLLLIHLFTSQRYLCGGLGSKPR